MKWGLIVDRVASNMILPVSLKFWMLLTLLSLAFGSPIKRSGSELEVRTGIVQYKALAEVAHSVRSACHKQDDAHINFDTVC